MRVIYTHSYLWMYLRMMYEEMKYVSVTICEYFFKICFAFALFLRLEMAFFEYTPTPTSAKTVVIL